MADEISSGHQYSTWVSVRLGELQSIVRACRYGMKLVKRH
jgi:hypothetical protein